jgi:hypothetical protein
MAEWDAVDETTVDTAVGPGIAAQYAPVRRAVGRTEAALRSINDQIRELAPTWDGMHVLLCECADPHCLRTLSIAAGVFDELRSASRRFLIAPGHERAGSETVVLRADDYFIVSRPSVPPGDAVIQPWPAT